jgi:hypothetical protein
MKAITLLLLYVVTFGLAVADTPDLIYLRIEPIIGDTPPLADAGIMAGCYIGPGKKCNGLFYMNDDGSGILVGSIINDLVPNPDFELLYSITLTKENGRDMLIGSAYAMQLSPEGEILGGRRTQIRQYLTDGENIVLAQPVGRLANGDTIFLQMVADRKRPKGDDKLAEHPITLISTQLVDGVQYSQVRNWYNRLRSARAFRTGFRSKEKNGHYEFLKYEIEIDLSSIADLAQVPLSGQLSFERTYTIDTLHHEGDEFSADVVYASKYTKDIEIVLGKMLKLVFPPDTPSVRGFDIEDTLIIVPQ